MQLLLLCYGVLLPANWAWRLASGGEINEARMFIFAMDMLVAALALVSIALIRHGRFKPAIMLFLALQLISLEIVFFRVGVLSQLIDPAPTMLTLVISGLVLGRRALWITFGLLMAVFATGFAVNVNRALDSGVPVGVALVNLPAVVISYALITIVLDRSVAALRESLFESNARGRELQHEMAERERAQAQLIHAQKLEASGRLASGISHDFNNILDVILGYAGQRHDIPDIENHDARDAAFAKALNGVEVAATRGAAITRKLLSFSRHDLANPQVFNAGQVLTELQPMLRQLFPRSVRVEVLVGADPLHVRIDRSEFEMLILNIAANARDAMPEGGRFHIQLGAATDEAVEITLSDTGHGMDEDVQQRIFEPFFSTKSAMEGTGLGLSVIRDLVHVAGGDIQVRSTVGQGTAFRVRLPLMAPPGDT
ncbi:sensor histidine kinase [Lysobacter cavernae]|uniref:histidine kinase n=1 Tax=Lysobacter cavernae TaxID=1685901 RepID=A0ABV7RQ72_9GAMM